MEGDLTRAQHYRDQAAKLRTMAEKEHDQKIREDLLTLATQYDGLAEELLKRVAISPLILPDPKP